jgi:hypothetical protein
VPAAVVVDVGAVVVATFLLLLFSPVLSQFHHHHPCRGFADALRGWCMPNSLLSTSGSGEITLEFLAVGTCSSIFFSFLFFLVLANPAL